MTQEEFKSTFNEHFDAIRNYLYYRSGNPELATDLAQETFLKLWEKQHTFNGQPQKNLLYKIANDLFISSYRREKVAQNYIMKSNPEYEAESPEDQLRYQELKQRYETALQDLPEKQRVVFLLSRMEDLKYHEIAERLELSVKAVEKRMKNALSYLRNALGR